MGLFKKAGCSWKRRVRQKPVSCIQLMFDFNQEKRGSYVRSFEEETQDVSQKESEDVFSCCAVGASDECSSGANARWFSNLNETTPV